MARYRILEQENYFGEKLYTPQIGYFLLGWHSYVNNPMSREELRFTDMQDAINYIQKIKERKIIKTGSYNLR